MTAKRHLSATGLFEVKRRADGLLRLWHVPTGLPAGLFSHLRVKSFRDALSGVNAVEERLAKVGESMAEPDEQTLRVFLEVMRETFPNGAWSH